MCELTRKRVKRRFLWSHAAAVLLSVKFRHIVPSGDLTHPFFSFFPLFFFFFSSRYLFYVVLRSRDSFRHDRHVPFEPLSIARFCFSTFRSLRNRSTNDQFITRNRNWNFPETFSSFFNYSVIGWDNLPVIDVRITSIARASVRTKRGFCKTTY